MSQEEFIEAQYTEGLTIGWEYEPPVPQASVCLEDARKLAVSFQAFPIVSQLQAIRHIEAAAWYGRGQVTAKTTPTAIANNLVVPLIVTVTRSWMRHGAHRNVYCRPARDREYPIESSGAQRNEQWPRLHWSNLKDPKVTPPIATLPQKNAQRFNIPQRNSLYERSNQELR